MKVSILQRDTELLMVFAPENEIDKLACQQMVRFGSDAKFSKAIPSPLIEGQFAEGSVSVFFNTSMVREAPFAKKATA